jgi:hypothetical protein
MILVQSVTGGEISSYGIGTSSITTSQGSALVVYAAWNSHVTGQYITVPSMSVSDSAGNLWRQVAISPLSSTSQLRCGIWMTTSAAPVSWISVNISGFSASCAWIAAEISGMPQAIDIDFSIGANGSGTGPSLTGTATGNDIGFMILAGNASLSVSSFPPAWTAVTSITEGAGGAGTGLIGYWNPSITSGSVAASWLLNSSVPYTLVMCAISAAGSPPAQYSPEFPLVIVEAAFGAQPGLSSSSTDYTWSSEYIFWTDISTRVIGDAAEGRITATRGRQYELSQEETGTLDMFLDNHDGAFTPTNPGSPYYSNAINANMSFQSGITPWISKGNAALSVSSAQTFASGLNGNSQQALVITPDGMTVNPGAQSEDVPINVNYPYSASAWIYAAATYSFAYVNLTYLNSSKVVISGTNGTSTVVQGGQWTQLTVTNLTPPAGAAYAFMQVVLQNIAPSTPFYVQEAAIVAGPSTVSTGLVAILTPVRVTMWWQGTQYPVWMGYVEQWPQTWPDMPQWGFAKITAIDAIGVLASISMSSALVSDVLLDNPYAYLPCNEQYTTSTVGATPANLIFFGNSPYYSPADANGLIALNKAPGNQITGTYSDGSAAQQVSTGLAMNFFGDNGTGMGATGYSGVLTGHRGPCMLYIDPGLQAISNASGGWTVEFWFTWNDALQSSINLFAGYGIASSFLTEGGGTDNGQVFLVQITNGLIAGSNALNVVYNGGSSVGPTITPSQVPQHVVIVFQPSVPGFTFYVNGVNQGTASLAVPLTPMNIGALILGPGSYSYDCNNNQFLGYFANNYSAGHLAVYPYQLPSNRITSHYTAGAAGYSGVTAANRFAQIITWALAGLKRGGYLTSGATGTPEITEIGPAYQLSGSSASDGINSVAQSEGGQFFVRADGTITYLERISAYNMTAQATLGDNATSATGPLNQNPGFSGTSPWTITGGSLTYVPSQSYGGFGSGLMTPTGSAATTTLASNHVPVTAGDGYYGAAWVLSPPGWGSVKTGIAWFNSGGGLISTALSSLYSLPGSAWTYISGMGTAPANAVTAAFQVLEEGTPAAADKLYVSYGSIIQMSPEIPYLQGTEFGFDNTYLYNEVVSTQQDGPNQVIEYDYRNTASQGQYFRRSALSFTQNVVSPYDVSDITTWSSAEFSQPNIHLNQLKIHVTANPLIAFTPILGLDIGGIVQVNRRPIGGAPISELAIIEHITVEMGARYFYVTYQMSPYQPSNNVLCADTPGFNVPGTMATLILGW